MMYEKSVTKFFYTLQYFGAPGDLLGQNSPISAMMYSKAPSINLPNFVPFWQPVYEISSAELRGFRWNCDRQTWWTKNSKRYVSAYHAATTMWNMHRI